MGKSVPGKRDGTGLHDRSFQRTQSPIGKRLQKIGVKSTTEPKWVADEGLWDKAKRAADKAGASDKYAFATWWYLKHGGGKQSEMSMPDLSASDKKLLDEAISSSSVSQLMRGTKKSEAGFVTRDKDSGRLIIDLAEAQVDHEKREVKCVLISEGKGNEVDKNYYSAEAVNSGAQVFNGAQCYINHPTESEQEERPEGDIWKLAGFWKDTRATQVDDKKTGNKVGAVEGVLYCDKSEAGAAALAKAEAAIKYREYFPNTDEVYAGMSINYNGIPKGTVEIDGEEWTNIAEFVRGGSIDVVTKPARGGAFVALEESVKSGAIISKAEADEMLTKEILDKLREAHKDRAKLIEEDAPKEKIEAVEQNIDDLLKSEQDEPETLEVDDELIEQLKDEIPQMEGESNEQYIERCKSAYGKMSAKMGEQEEPEPEPKEQEEPDPEDSKKTEASKEVKDFQKKEPKMFQRIMEHARVKLDEERKDFSSERSKVKKLSEDNRKLTVELSIMKDQQLAAKKLSEAEIPEKFLSVSDLVGKSAKEMNREIERTKAILESRSPFGSGFAKEAGQPGGGLVVDPSAYGLPTVEK